MGEKRRKPLPLTLAVNLLQPRRLKGYLQPIPVCLAESPHATLARMESGSGKASRERLIRVTVALRVSNEKPPRALRAASSRPRAGHSGQNRGPRRHPGRPGTAEAIHGLDILRISLAPGTTHRGHRHLRDTGRFLQRLRGTGSTLVAGHQPPVETGDMSAFPGDQTPGDLNRKNRT